MKRYRITYKQKYMNEILVDTYIKTVSNYGELMQAEQALYSDPHVFSVDWEELTDD